jgi:hypothetical protein
VIGGARCIVISTWRNDVMETGLACTCNPLKGKRTKYCMVSCDSLVWKREESIQGFLARITRKGKRVGVS